MSKATGETASDSPTIVECPVRAAAHHARHNDRHYATRSEVIGTLARGSRSFEEINQAISAACGDADLMRSPDDHSRLIPIDEIDDPETLVELLEDYLGSVEAPNRKLIGRINARCQELRYGGDS